MNTIIDFHAHIFPDSLAPRARARLLQAAGGIYDPVTDMTEKGLARFMAENGIDRSVVQPVVTKPSQTIAVNTWAAGLDPARFTPFGGVHPDTDDYQRDVDFVASLGLKGLKFQAEYQNFLLDEPRMLRIYDYALSRGLILLFHAGFDPAYPAPYKTSPRRFANVAKAMGGGVIVAAHLGGQDQWDDVLRYLPGTGVYVDTSMGFEYYGEARFLQVYQSLGADHLLFASDSPWSHAGKELARIRALPIPETDKAQILGGNARRLLGLTQAL